MTGAVDACLVLVASYLNIDIAAAMTLWIPRRGTSCGEYRRRMTLKVEVHGARLNYSKIKMLPEGSCVYLICRL